MDQRKEQIRRLATELGFDRVGIAPAEPPPHAEFLRTWLDRGYAGQMRYMHDHFEIRRDPRRLLPDARSVICLAMNYHQREAATEPDESEDPKGQIACYAWGQDYHDIIRGRLDTFVERLADVIGEPFESRLFVDTAPVLERPLAAAAGIGWIGKNTALLVPRLGSFVFLAGLVTTLPLAPDAAVPDRCGRCNRCIEACPARAIVEPYVVDARRCISYLTIELRETIPAEFRPAIGDRIFGCDVCQRVCPHNRRAPLATESCFMADSSATRAALTELLNLSRDRYLELTRDRATRRAKLDMLRRNAAVALGNVGSPVHIPTLQAVVGQDDLLLAEHARWAIDRIERRRGA